MNLFYTQEKDEFDNLYQEILDSAKDNRDSGRDEK